MRAARIATLPLTRSDRAPPRGAQGSEINIRCMCAVRVGFKHRIAARPSDFAAGLIRLSLGRAIELLAQAFWFGFAVPAVPNDWHNPEVDGYLVALTLRFDLVDHAVFAEVVAVWDEGVVV